MNKVTSLYTAYHNQQPLDLDYFVEWHTWLWRPAVQAVLGDPYRFVGKRVLELGCARGRMSCLFALLGANVTGVELFGKSLETPAREVQKWQLEDKITLQHYDGNPDHLPEGPYDFVFCKSVLVIVPDLPCFLTRLTHKMSPQGELLAVENMQRGTWLRAIRIRFNRFINTGKWGKNPYSRFQGVTPDFLNTLQQLFNITHYQESYKLVAAIQAQRRPTMQNSYNE